MKICFVCHGNICRSPMAELLFKKMLKESGELSLHTVVSRATHLDEIGNGVYYMAKPIYDGLDIDYSNHRATLLTKSDYEKYDLFIGMDNANLYNMQRLFNGDKENKVKLLLSFAGENREVADPWYTRDFNKTYSDIMLGLKALYKTL